MHDVAYTCAHNHRWPKLCSSMHIGHVLAAVHTWLTALRSEPSVYPLPPHPTVGAVSVAGIVLCTLSTPMGVIGLGRGGATEGGSTYRGVAPRGPCLIQP